MSDNIGNHNNQNEESEKEKESFAELFESYQVGMSENLKVGDQISGSIIAMDRD